MLKINLNHHLAGLWNKMSTMPDILVLCKMAAIPMPTGRFKTNSGIFQIRYCMMFYLKEYQNYHPVEVKISKKVHFCYVKSDL